MGEQKVHQDGNGNAVSGVWKRYRKIPVVIEAMGPIEGELTIRTLDGDHHASPGDYIICGVKGELYPCKPDVFARTYVGAESVTCPECGGEGVDAEDSSKVCFECRGTGTVER